MRKTSGKSRTRYPGDYERTPLEYMLWVMNDPTADPSRRDRMATAAAPYCHQRMSERYVGVKERAALELHKGADGTAWSALITDNRDKAAASLNAA